MPFLSQPLPPVLLQVICRFRPTKPEELLEQQAGAEPIQWFDIRGDQVRGQHPVKRGRAHSSVGRQPSSDSHTRAVN
jgi:hypothetical protein